MCASDGNHGGTMANRNFAIYLLLALASVVRPIAARADTVAYDLTGTVTSVSGVYSGLARGTAVTGTYYFNVANGQAGQSVSTSTNWLINGSTSDVFWGTVQAAQFSDSTDLSAGPGPRGANDEISGSPPVAGESYGWQYYAGTTVYSSDYNTIAFDLLAQSGTPFTNDGLPLFSSATSASGEFATSTGAVQYSISTFTQVPSVSLPPSFWLLIGGLGGMFFVVRGRRYDAPNFY
jgi:hypothetical protein